MADPCRQESNIATLQATIASISKTLEKMEGGQKRFIEVLERIAEQGQRIIHLEESMTRQEKDTDGLFARVRALEMAPAEEGNKVKFGIFSQLLSIVGAVVTAIITVKFFGR